MEQLVSKLQFQARAHPANSVLKRALLELQYLLNGARRNTPDVEETFKALRRDLDVLATEGIWEPSREDEDSLVRLRQKLGLVPEDSAHEGHNHIDTIENVHTSHRAPSTERAKSVERARKPDYHSKSPPHSPGKPNGQDNPIVQLPPIQTPLLPVQTTAPTVLPLELVQELNHTFFLHLLATDPERVLPPGKSLLSTMTSPRAQAREGEVPKLEGRVHDMVHKAFWEDALKTLSDPSPAVQLPRLKALYADLLVALKPLLSRSHPILVTLSSPLSPTSAPLRSGIMHLREILAALRERCAPARDAHIDQLIAKVDEPSQMASVAELAQLIVDIARAILELTEAMKDDLSQFVLGEMDEKDLKAVITQQAMLREKTLVLQLWPPSRIEPAWKTWLDGLQTALFPNAYSIQSPHHRWVYRLVQALGAGSPVVCPLPIIRIPGSGASQEEEVHGAEKPPNALPPPFFVPCPSLLVAQNYLQALVIAASLRSLVRLPPRFASSRDADDGLSFMERVWTLLKSSLDEEPTDGEGQTKIINLEDEVVRVRRACADAEHPCTPEEEGRLRTAVDRTLHPTDPVFLLLQKRLVQGLATWLVSVSSHSDEHGSGPASRATSPTPIHMRTGRDRPGKRPRLHLGLDDPKSVFVGWERERARPPAIKGFEDEVLVREVWETFKKIGAVVDWTDTIWQDLIETGEVGGPSRPPSRAKGDLSREKSPAPADR
ncbi:hypothetical protein TRAPUB_14137 [Trametes pubescens]|uniref:Uncharacterized protein n=1 Tax=Trametes pubescens TaxID=154538 RepID=A0A1M2VP59_TRAPU|nr:hypothetical protein TRAPUB_14137 [Trametes pubescens]